MNSPEAQDETFIRIKIVHRRDGDVFRRDRNGTEGQSLLRRYCTEIARPRNYLREADPTRSACTHG